MALHTRRVLIISPYFPPSNAPDMQRVRMSLAYFSQFGWEAEVVTVDPVYSEIVKDNLLLESIPPEIPIHQVKAWSKKWTGKLGLGSLALRSMWYYKRKVNALLKTGKFDLIYFSTTQFPLCILGAYWRKKFDIPYVIDMQDPWHSEYYQNKPKKQRPRKYWFSYRLNKWLEPIAMSKVSGIISVSEKYVDDLKGRYPAIKSAAISIITFAAFEKDFELTETHKIESVIQGNKISITYLGRGGADMSDAAKITFRTFKEGLKKYPLIYEKVHFYFIGTSYAPSGEGNKTISPIADQMGLQQYVEERTDRVSFFKALSTLKHSDGLIILGSDDIKYTASKLYPYVLSQRPLLAIFPSQSSVVDIINQCKVGKVIEFGDSEETCFNKFHSFVTDITRNRIPETDWKAFQPYMSISMTRKQCDLFDEVLNNAK